MSLDILKEQAVWSNLPRRTKRGILTLKENAIIKDGQIYDKDGNDRSDYVELVVKTTDRQIKALKAVDELSTHEIENGGFVFAFFESCKTMKERFPSLTQSDMARLMLLGTYCGYESGRLQHDNGRQIDKKSLRELLNVKERAFREFYKKMIVENILQEVNNELYVNPSIFYRGAIHESPYDLRDYKYTRLFRQTVRDLYAKYNSRTVKQLAIIYAVLPFLNFDYNVVCYNPHESDEDKLKPMDLSTLAKLLGYENQTKLKTALERIKLDGRPVFWLPQNVNDKRKRRIVVNPRVVFAGSAESLKAVKVLFN